MKGYLQIAGLTTFLLLSIGFQDAIAQYYGVRQFTLQHGLPTSQIKTLISDDLGYLWIGTHGGGLVRFDGVEFVTYTVNQGLVNNYITALCRDNADNIWVGTLLGISRFDGVLFTTIDLNLSDTASHKERMIKQLVKMHNEIFVLNDAGDIGQVIEDKIHWRKKDPAKFLIDNQREELLYQNNANEIRSLTDSTFRVALSPDLVLYSTSNYFGEGAINSNRGLFTIRSQVVVPLIKGFDRGPLIVNERDSILWTLDNHLIQYQLTNNGEAIEQKEYRKIFQITSWVVDPLGEVWIGTYTQGLFNLKKREFEKIFAASEEDAIMPIERASDKGFDFWFGSFGNGLIRYDEKIARRQLFNDDVRKNYAVALKRQQSKVWVGTMGGLAVIESEKIKWVNDKNNSAIDSVLAIDLDDKNRIWVGRADKGIEIIDDSGIKHIPFEDKAAISIRYSSLDSALYIGTFQGIFKYAGGKISELDIPGIKVGIVRSIDIYKKKYLVFTSEDDGVYFYNLIDQSISSVSLSDGLLSPLIYFLKADGDYIWVGSVRGINKIRVSNNFQIKEVLSFNEENGFDGIETSTNSVLIDGRLKLFGSIDGVYQYVDSTESQTNAGQLHLQDVKLFYGERSSRLFSDSLIGFFKIPYNPLFSATDNHLTFKFNSVGGSISSKIKYTYQLGNFDSRWSQRSPNREVTYSSLPPGNYTFRVKAVDGISGRTLEEIFYPFQITPPFYQTSWFLIIVILSSALVGVVAFKIQVRKRVKKMMELSKAKADENQRLRQEIGRDFHDELGNHLVMVSSNVNHLLLKSDKSEEKEILQKIEQSIRYINLRTRDFIWSINPTNNNLDDLFLYVRDFAEGLFKNTKIVFRAENKIIHDHPVSYKFSRESILIFKEAFTNALKHSGATNVFFGLSSDDDTFAFVITDDGIGVQSKNEKSGGLTNIHYRAKKIGANLLLDSQLSGGTKIVLNFSMNGIKI